MIKIQYLRPFHIKHTGDKLRLTFSNEQLTIAKDEQEFHFIAIEGKEMSIDLKTMQIENLSEVFVFQCGNRFIRLSLYQMAIISDLDKHLKPILDMLPQTEVIETSTDEAVAIVAELEKQQLMDAIDVALDNRREALFVELSNKLQEVSL
ncbi:IDEAL domain-containing protein [Solibacillus sp. FSL H8-0538]|uniref:IDEAL domain-containing protein n=1 Tax=Solibacillus sp. FSL H8-0538 TaxID=2921400 RepID=UPI0030F88136